MEERRGDLRVARTKAAIVAAFEELAASTHPDKITVKAITDKAGINRKTFYLHYDSMESFLDERIEEVIDVFFDEHEETPEVPEDIDGHAQRFFLFLSQQDVHTEQLICSRSNYDFGGKLYRLQMQRYKDAGDDPLCWMGENKENLVLHFIRSTALQFYRRWVRTGKTVHAKEAAVLLGELTTNGISNLMR